MMSMMELLDALREQVPTVAWTAWEWDMPTLTESWGTVKPDGDVTDNANDKKDDKAFTGTIDLYTRTAVASLIDLVEIVLTESRMAWHQGDILYDRNARAVHIVWDWATVEGIGE